MRCSIAAFLLLVATHARAQDTQGDTYNLQLFRPALDSKGTFTVNASQPLGHLDFSIGLVGVYARRTLELAGNGATFSVSELVTANLQAALGLFKWAQIGVSLPVHIVFGSRSPSYVSAMDPNANNDLRFGGQFVGDLGIHPKVRVLNTSRHPIGLALSTSVYVPSGRSSQFLGEGNVSLRPELILDKEFGFHRRFRVSLNAGALVRFSSNTFTDNGTFITDPTVMGGASFCAPPCGTGESRTLGTQLTYSLGLSGAVVPGTLDLLFELVGMADLTGASRGYPLEWLAGAKVYLASKSYFQIGAGTLLVPGQTGAALPRAIIGFIFEPAVGDRDQDSIKDDVDRCPDDPEDYDAFEDEDGCLDPDNDKDRILDKDDRCPNHPETRNGVQDEDGCPDEADRDGDRLLDRADKCPDDPEDYDDFEDPDGCPDPDNDKDRILDLDDLCPNDAEIYNGLDDQDGCPDDDGITRLRRGVVQVFKKIHFETAKATIKPRSYPTLDAVTATLQGNPQLKRVEVQGHADERGNDDYNLRLTEDRAQAVKTYLIEHGVHPERLQARGYGETKAVCRRHHEACWSKNRRVEFIILRQDGVIPGQQ